MGILLGDTDRVATIDKGAALAELPGWHGVWIAIGHQELLLNAGLVAQSADVLWLRQIRSVVPVAGQELKWLCLTLAGPACLVLRDLRQHQDALLLSECARIDILLLAQVVVQGG